MSKERRRHVRSGPSRGLEVRCASAEHADRHDERYNLATRIIDVSARGACLVTVGRLRKGVPVTVDLFVPNRAARFRSKATVQWSTTVESRGRVAHVAGLYFDRLFTPERPAKKEKPAAAHEPRPGRLIPSRGPEPMRKHKRFSPEEVSLVCLSRGLLRTLGLATNTGRRLKDLSRGGAQIVCSRKLKPGDRVDLRLEFGRSELNIEAEGVIRWCRRDTASLEPRYLAGVVFKNLPEGSERSLRAIERTFIGF